MELMKRQVTYRKIFNISELRRKEKWSPGAENVEFKFKTQDILHSLNILFFIALFALPWNIMYTHRFFIKDMPLFFYLKKAFLSSF